MIVDQALYRDGTRRPCGDLSDELEGLRADPHGTDFLWIGLKDPTDSEFELVNDELRLHPLAVEDAVVTALYRDLLAISPSAPARR